MRATLDKKPSYGPAVPDLRSPVPALEHGASKPSRAAKQDLGQLKTWIVEQATSCNDEASLLDGFCKRLIEAGFPIWRLSVSTPAIDPHVRGFTYGWSLEDGGSLVLAMHGAEGQKDFERGPIHYLLETGKTFCRWRLDRLQVEDGFPELHALREQGGTDFVMHAVKFAPGTALAGVGIAFTTAGAGGFSMDDLTGLGDVIPALSLAVCKLSLSRTLRESLSIYLGPATGARVLEGQSRRGQGRTMAATILVADLRAFTALSDCEDPMDVVGWLDEHFDALGEPVLANGGEILKFTGDGFLAIFPVADPEAQPCHVCGRALAAAEAALQANRNLNVRRRASGLPELDVDLVLHYGEVVYGNVGMSRRLDFTVIGPTVNEASRIEKFCDELGRALLLSDAFAARCARRLVRLGLFPMRGCNQPQRIWSTRQ